MGTHKIRTLAATVFMLAAVSGTAPAAGTTASAKTSETFPIKICGTQVTTENMNNILGDGTAKFRFDGDHTLTICTYPGSNLTEKLYLGSEPIIYSELDGLVITTINSPIITSEKDAIVLNADTTLKACSLSIHAKDTAIIMKSGKRLTICDSSRITTTSTLGITGWVGGETLDVDSSYLDVTSTTRAVCFFNGGITLNSCHIAQPEGGIIGRSTIDQAGGESAVRVIVIPTRGEMRSDDGEKLLSWEYVPSTGEVTVTSGNVSDDTPLIAASYDENGVLLKAAMIADENTAAATGIGASRIKLLRWSMSDLSPLCPAAELRLTD